MQIKTEPLGDLLLISQLIKSTGLVERVEEYFPRHHLWRGPGVGETLMGLLLYIISESDHRMCQVEHWASSREDVLRWCLGNEEFTSAHLSDDRLGNLLDLLSKGLAWSAFQKAQNESLIRIYELDKSSDDGGESHRTVRIDTTTAQSDRPLGGLFGLGYNAHGSDMPQLKVVLLALDKANFPLTMHTVGGDEGDDNLYTPVLKQAWQEGLARSGILVVGDSKLCNQRNMGFIAASENYYLGPLSQRQHSAQALLQGCRWIEQQAERPQEVMRLAAKAKEAECIALVKELPAITMCHPDDKNQQWTQRLFAVCTLSKREKQLKQLEHRMDSTRTETYERLKPMRGRKTLNQLEQAQAMVQTILKKHRTEALFNVTIHPSVDKTSACEVQLEINEAALADERMIAGWRVMATNAPENRLSAYDAVLCYWEEYRIEQQFHLMLNKCTALMPIYLKKDNRIQALTHVIMLALQYSNLWQYTIRQQLAQEKDPFITHVVPGNPGMKVHNPTTKLVLSAFKNIQFIHVNLPNNIQIVQIQGIQESHLKLLDLLKLPRDLFMHPLCQRT